ncbi:histidine kinase [uncultured Maribacter sp.]|uniref:sensor histidine kinase n=1 Tax=uncultured Maribacter sp. TaxID=431308 RepID=UPI0030ECE14F
MISILKKNNWLIVKILALISILIPLGIMAYEFIVLGNESVVFLEDYPVAVGVIIIIYYTILLVIGILWILSQLSSLLTLRNETRKNEIQHLQSQVNPHFFFNMLNNIYGLVDKDTEKTKKLILKLSELMRYSIYEGEKTTVTLADEVAYIQNYIALHKIRYHKAIDIQFNTQVEENSTIMPLLLIILVENAFKHGVENLRENAYVHINLKADSHKLVFEIENNFDEKELPEEEGIGLKNLKRRLHLVYPKKYTLNSSSNNGIYKAQLELQL